MEQHTSTCQVALFDKTLALINEARTTVQDFRENLIAILQPKLFSTIVSSKASEEEGEVEEGERLELAQPIADISEWLY